MVQLREFQTPGPVLTVVGLITGVGVTGIGIGLVARNYDDPFAAVWSSLFVLGGLICLISYVGLILGKRPQPGLRPPRDTTFENEQARYLPRSANPAAVAGNIVYALLGGWFLFMGVVGAVEDSWLWPVLAAFPAAYFLGFLVLRVAGRFRSGSVWLTETRIVDEHLGLRREIELTNVKTAYDLFDAVRVEPEDPSSIRYKRLAPRLWCARLVPGEMLIQANGLKGGPEGLAAEVRERAVAAQSEPKRRWWGP
ncbi:hypothetical protein ACFU7D_19830 [Nocardioides sp. NPDC057577]|uniref:hypothetical protein n=1 Tax=Nocardioides sp. NPDC057577 TaxID=3346171 RepID=UPI00366F71A6